MTYVHVKASTEDRDVLLVETDTSLGAEYTSLQVASSAVADALRTMGWSCSPPIPVDLQAKLTVVRHREGNGSTNEAVVYTVVTWHDNNVFLARCDPRSRSNVDVSVHTLVSFLKQFVHTSGKPIQNKNKTHNSIGLPL